MKSRIIGHQLPEAPAPAQKVTLQCEVTPGKVETVEVPGEMLERFVAVRIVPVPGRPGVYRAQVKAYAPLLPLTDDLGQRMGWGLERRQILALACAGFIDAYRGTTGATQVDPISVWEHIENTRLCTDEDGRSLAQEFWTPERIRHYSDAQEFVRASGIVPASRRESAADVPHLEFDFGNADETQPNAA